MTSAWGRRNCYWISVSGHLQPYGNIIHKFFECFFPCDDAHFSFFVLVVRDIDHLPTTAIMIIDFATRIRAVNNYSNR